MFAGTGLGWQNPAGSCPLPTLDVLARYAVETNCYQLIFFLAGYYQLIVAHANGAADWHPLGKQPTGQAFCAN